MNEIILTMTVIIIQFWQFVFNICLFLTIGCIHCIAVRKWNWHAEFKLQLSHCIHFCAKVSMPIFSCQARWTLQLWFATSLEEAIAAVWDWSFDYSSPLWQGWAESNVSRLVDCSCWALSASDSLVSTSPFGRWTSSPAEPMAGDS